MSSQISKELIRRDYPGVYESYVLQASLPETKYAEKELFWKNHDITCFERWAVPYFVEREKEKKKPCLRLNYPYDGKCTDCVEKRCRYDRVCFMCGQDGHGAFQVFNNGKLNGKFKCIKHRTFTAELDALYDKFNISEEDIKVLFFVPEVASKASTSASAEKKEEVKEPEKKNPAATTTTTTTTTASSTSTTTAAAKIAASVSSISSKTSTPIASNNNNNPPLSSTIVSRESSGSTSISNSAAAAPASSSPRTNIYNSSTSSSNNNNNSNSSSNNNNSNVATSSTTVAAVLGGAHSNNSNNNNNTNNNSHSNSSSVHSHHNGTSSAAPTTASSKFPTQGGSQSIDGVAISPQSDKLTNSQSPTQALRSSSGSSTSSNSNSSSNSNNLFSNDLSTQIPLNMNSISVGAIQNPANANSLSSISSNFGGNFNNNNNNSINNSNNNSNININGGIESIGTTIDDVAIKGMSNPNANRPLSIWGDSGGFNNSYGGFNFDTSIFDSGAASSNLYSQLGLGVSHSQLGGLNSNIANSFMAPGPIGALVGGGGLGNGPLFGTLSLGPDSILSPHNPLVNSSISNPLQTTLHLVSTSLVNYQVPDSEEFFTSCPSVRVMFSNSNFLRQIGNGLLYRGLLMASRGQEDVAVLIVKRSQIIDRLKFKNEISNLRQLGYRYGYNVARTFQKSIMDINYPSNINSGGEEYNIITSEYSEIGYLDGLMSKLSQGIPLIDIQFYALQLIEGLARIHESNMFHLNIRPQSILVSAGEKYQPKLSSAKLCLKYTNFKLSSIPFKEYTSNECWSDPESIEPMHGYVVNSAPYDVFSLGCILFYIASDGKCLYESVAQAIEASKDHNLRTHLIKRTNIHIKSYMLFDLIELMTRPSSMKTNSPRISLDMARCHPFLWSTNTRVSILIDLALDSAKPHIEKSPQWEFFNRLEEIGKKLIFTEKWTSQMDSALVSCIQPPNLVTDYNSSTRGLLQAIHNLYIRQEQLLSAVYPQLSKSQITIEFITRITEINFPKLLVAIFTLMNHFGSWRLENDELKHYWGKM